MPFTLGIDYGANSVRALLVDVSNGRELATCVLDYEVANKVSSAMPTRSGNARAITSSVWRNRCVAPWSKPPRTQLFWPRTSSASAWTPRFEPAPGGGAQRSSGPARAVEGSPGWRNVGYGKINTSSREADRITGMAVKHRPHYMARSATPILPSGSRARSGIAWNIAPGVFDALEVHPLSIGGKQDPVRLVFNAPAGPAITASIVDLGNRFRVIVNEVDSVEPPPKLPVARAVWKCRSDFKTACATWIYAGGAHHTGYSYGVTAEHMEDFAEIAGVEFAVIDAKTELRDFKEQLRQGEIYYHLAPGLGRL